MIGENRDHTCRGRPLYRKVADLLIAGHDKQKIMGTLNISSETFNGAKYAAAEKGLVPPTGRGEVSDSIREALIAELLSPTRPAYRTLAATHGISRGYIERLAAQLRDEGRMTVEPVEPKPTPETPDPWAMLPPDAFQDDPRACRPMVGRPILHLRWAQ